MSSGMQLGRRQRREVPLSCLDVEIYLLWVRDHHSILINLLRQCRVLYALLLANEFKAVCRSASHPVGVVDGVDGVPVRLDVVDVALILSLSAQTELTIQLYHFLVARP